jgi:hypothetical protein
MISMLRFPKHSRLRRASGSARAVQASPNKTFNVVVRVGPVKLRCDLGLRCRDSMASNPEMTHHTNSYLQRRCIVWNPDSALAISPQIIRCILD